ncbi:UDP-2,3-diacylglucosamine diphosphatase [Marinospirillum alkaliphilum]|uniref:UDP-2,3-diacylglucosamine hydrolase n=1 Tax=Marinospirillum alkaliphilum DSM 21637 TaxID=1122209 RepID=A0A1K1TBP2_9GAMM|nr:UDP-2,3-diacylglucosamine diphosphatase [Marinospirillum alkaliphilum]SFW97930.1 UDP-2,3-diacylglucosamine hydrolase [Marinospirillum alkaliphilum DSM 21637]
MQLFISDLHLHEDRPALSRAFLHFLAEQAPRAEVLYLLGDIFDIWIGDDAMTPYHQEMAAALKKLSETGTRIYLMHGNRDFLLRHRFCRLAGCELLPDPCVIRPYGEPILLMHGDLLCTRDEQYQKMRRVLRNPIINFILRNLPLSQRRKLAAKTQQISKSLSSKKEAGIVDVTEDEVIRRMQEHQVTTLIHGHTHRPAVHDLTLQIQQQTLPGKRYVLGDWTDSGAWKLELDETGLRLLPFNY